MAGLLGRLRRSIRWRLTLSISAVLILAVGIAFAIIYRQTGSRLRSQLDGQVRLDARQFAQSLALAGQDSPGPLLGAAREYVAAEPFSSVSTVLFALMPGARPVSNYPELLSPVPPDDGESAPEQRHENELSAQLRRAHLGASVRWVPDVGQVTLYERRVTVAGRSVVVAAAQPLEVVERAEHGVVGSFLIAGIFIALAVLIGSYLVGSRITAPLRRMARVAAQVDAGDLEPRIAIDPGRPIDEVGVLALAFNHMLGRLERAFRTQREFVAEASHELRTPITVVQGQLEVLAAREHPAPEDVRRVERLVRAETERMRRIVDDLLLLAQADRTDFLRREPIELSRFLAQVHDDATLIADRRFELGGVPRGALLADPDRLAQALRNLIANAIDHTAPGTGIVRIEAEAGADGSVRLAVLDDGPGIPPGEEERIFERFHRSELGRSGPESSGRGAERAGAGLGLAIVRAIAEAHGGDASASNDGLDGGARVELWLPGFVPTPAALLAGR
jgi:signal transduction histidine kinase